MTEPLHAKVSEEDYQKVLDLINNQEPYPDEMLDAVEVANRELQKEEWERKVRSDRILFRYNEYYNLETSGLPWGTAITPEHQQMITLQSMIDALRCENLNHEFDVVSTADIEDLIERLREQANEFLERVKDV